MEWVKPEKGSKGGRPAAVFDEEDIIKVEALAAVMGLDGIADYFGISRDSLDRVRKDQPDVERRYKYGKANAISIIGGKLVRQAQDGHFLSQQLYLTTQGGWKREQSIDHTSSDGSMSQPSKITIAGYKEPKEEYTNSE
jgi:hypothetical protein